MMDDVERQLRADLDTVASRDPHVTVDVAGLARTGRRERARRLGLAAAGASVVAVVAIVGTTAALGGSVGPADPGVPATSPTHPTSPTTSTTTPSVASLAEGLASTAPWWRGGELHAAGVVARYDRGQGVMARFAGGVTLALVHADDEWQVIAMRAGESIVIARRSGRFIPFSTALSADGSLAAVSEATDDGTRRVSLTDLRTGEVIGTTEVAVSTYCCAGGGELYVAGVTADGRVVWGIDATTYVWTPGTDPVEVTGTRSTPSLGGQAWPGGLTYQGVGPFDETPGVYGTLDADGRFERVGRTAVDQIGAWSTDGARFAYPGDVDGANGENVTDRLWLEGPGLERVEVTLPVPLFGVVGWESTDEVIVAVGEPRAVVLLRCDATTLTCERIADGPPARAEVPDGY